MTALYFDLDGTLVRHTIPFEELFERARRELNLPARSGLYESYTGTFLDYLGDCHPEPYRAAMADICEEFAIPTDGETFAETLVETELSRVAVADGAPELLAELAADHRLGVLTNGAGRVQREKLEVCGLAEYFETVVVSCEVGAGKPDPEIFERAKANIPDDEHVFVADDLERDVLPAQEAEFAGVWLSESDDSRADSTVEELSAVRDIVA
ncbi:HAD family hydrolase [Haladaptatus salinisoli]|uniref:HAD family hydrolase n=1 Tax=Haladaptatus salinisoli TaxID=2884876 RepID=UPI001D0A76D7|nr:HAD family hydrolase [Haladaptatus salinisoli]